MLRPIGARIHRGARCNARAAKECASPPLVSVQNVVKELGTIYRLALLDMAGAGKGPESYRTIPKATPATKWRRRGGSGMAGVGKKVRKFPHLLGDARAINPPISG